MLHVDRGVNVDPSVEQDILGALRGAAAGTTVLVVAYRMATITLADEVVFIDAGQVLDHGTHEALLGRCEGYAALVSAYAREAADRAAVAADEVAADQVIADEVSAGEGVR